LAYADDINIGGENIDAIQKNTKSLLYGSKEVGLQVNLEKIKYMLVSRCQKEAIIRIYAPVERKTLETKEIYNDLRGVYGRSCKNECIILAGGFNTRVTA
jgi:hypothetical protein